MGMGQWQILPISTNKYKFPIEEMSIENLLKIEN
jgi:hypothetical protein